MTEKAFFAVVGDPIAQSLSPLIHNGWIRAIGLPADYRAVHILDGEFAQGMATLERQNVVGLNVTAPHKHAALEYCKDVSLTAARIGAVNTLIKTDDGVWRGENTDKAGFIRGLTRMGLTDLSGKTVLVLGAGGAARAVVAALVEAGARIMIANRTLGRARQLAEDFGLSTNIAISFDQGLGQLSTQDLVINTTSLGHSGSLEIDWPEGGGKFFYDISYGKAARHMLEPAARAGWTTEDGLGMLVGQAAVAFEHWFGDAPDEAEAFDRCRHVLEAVGA